MRSAIATTISDATICAASQAPRKVAAAVRASMGRGAADGRNPPGNEALPRAESTTVRPYLPSGSDGHRSVRRRSGRDDRSVDPRGSSPTAPTSARRGARRGRTRGDLVRGSGGRATPANARSDSSTSPPHVPSIPCASTAVRTPPTDSSRTWRQRYGGGGARGWIHETSRRRTGGELDVSTTWHRLRTRLALPG